MTQEIGASARVVVTPAGADITAAACEYAEGPVPAVQRLVVTGESARSANGCSLLPDVDNPGLFAVFGTAIDFYEIVFGADGRPAVEPFRPAAS